MQYTQIIINSSANMCQTLSDVFLSIGALSVAIEDQFEGTDKEEAIFGEPEMNSCQIWQNSKLTILFSSNDYNENLIPVLQDTLDLKFEYTVDTIAEQDWVRLTQSQFQPIQVSEKLCITPSWCTNPNPNALNLTLDPGLAFGTGSHPTTFMCLKWLSDNVNSSHSVLDYGCGSGILALSAKKLGAHTVKGIDIDNQAVSASIQNAKNNDLAVEFSLPENEYEEKFDIVVANILAAPLKMLAPILLKLSKNKLILSGILETQADELISLYSLDSSVKIADTIDGWVLLECNVNNEIRL